MKLSIRIGLVIGAISIVVSSIAASLSYYAQLSYATKRSELLVSQLASSAARTSAIAAYLDDTELAQEIVAGLVANELIAHAHIQYVENTVEAGTKTAKGKTSEVKIALINPFIESEAIGQLLVTANNKFIQNQASSASLQNAILMVSLSVFIALIVVYYVRRKLTLPLRKLSVEVSKIDTSAPEEMQDIDFHYEKRDEIGGLMSKTNLLIKALQHQFRSEKAIRKTTEELQRRFRLIFDQATAGIALLKQDGYISTSNPAFNLLFGEHTEGKCLANFFESPTLVKSQLARLANEPNTKQIDIDLVIKLNQETRYLHCLFSSIADDRESNRIGSETLVELIVYDVTARRNEEEKARFEADHDSLTGLLNRRAGTQKLGELYTHCHHSQTTFALMMIDLDKFKPINDTHGHEAGDAVLIKVSECLANSASSSQSVVARWGGDEFVIAIESQSEVELEKMAKGLLQCVKQDIEILEGTCVQVGASIGIVMLESSYVANEKLQSDPAKNKEVDIEQIIHQADELMYEVKMQGRDNYLLKPFIALGKNTKPKTKPNEQASSQDA